MKTFIGLALLGFIIGNLYAVDKESYEYIDRLLSLGSPGQPELYEDSVIFTAPSSYRKVGIAFAHEGFSRIYWFQKLLLPIENTEVRDSTTKVEPELYQDSGLLFYTYEVPDNRSELAYRLIINGLWTADPLNPLRRLDKESGMELSLVNLPALPRKRQINSIQTGEVHFDYRASPGQTITVAGDFNGWDPFMYELTEESAGTYSLTLPLPVGTWHYVYYHKGQRLLDPNNLNRVYYASGKTASEVIVR